MNNKIVLSVKNLNKTYNKNIHALKNLNLEVKEGEIFGLLGPNGAGKSTFINILAGLTTKTSGDVVVWGFNMDDNPRQVRASLGIVPQEINVDPFFTPRKLLELQAGLYGVKKKDRITDTILDLVSLSEKANSYTRNLSGGMQRRLLIAKALVHKPPIIILDEPTAGVDIELRRSLWDFLTEINNNGTTIILTTHYLEEAEKLCKNISIIDKGEIVKTSSMQSLLRELDTEIFIFDLKDQIDPKSISNSPFDIKILDTYQISVEINKSQSLNEIFRYLNENNLNILSMRNETNRLEELFLDLTEK